MSQVAVKPGSPEQTLVSTVNSTPPLVHRDTSAPAGKLFEPLVTCQGDGLAPFSLGPPHLALPPFVCQKLAEAASVSGASGCLPLLYPPPVPTSSAASTVLVGAGAPLTADSAYIQQLLQNRAAAASNAGKDGSLALGPPLAPPAWPYNIYYPYGDTLLSPYALAPGYGYTLDGARRKNATRETTSTLKAWLNEHKKNPYPTKGEKIMLAIITKMTLTQVSTWFANARRRLKKENKMTWEPRNRTDDDDGDSDMDDARSDEDTRNNRVESADDDEGCVLSSERTDRLPVSPPRDVHDIEGNPSLHHYPPVTFRTDHMRVFPAASPYHSISSPSLQSSALEDSRVSRSIHAADREGEESREPVRPRKSRIWSLADLAVSSCSSSGNNSDHHHRQTTVAARIVGGLSVRPHHQPPYHRPADASRRPTDLSPQRQQSLVSAQSIESTSHHHQSACPAVSEGVTDHSNDLV